MKNKFYRVKVIIILLSLIFVSLIGGYYFRGVIEIKKTIQPNNHINTETIIVYPDEVIINGNNFGYSKVKGTGSMRPTIGDDSTLIGITDFKEEDIGIGDIVTFNMKNHSIVHRIIKIKQDTKGIKYYVTKGDNTIMEDDPIYFEDMKMLIVGIIY